MGLATLILYYNVHDTVDSYILSGSQNVKAHFDQKVKERANIDFLQESNGLASLTSYGLQLEGYVLLDWMEEIFGKLEHTSATQCAYHYVFRAP